MSFKIENLKSNTQYEFRIQYKSSMNGGERSDWSPIFQVQTTSEPMTGETVFKAIALPGKDQLEKLLKILYTLKIFNRSFLNFIYIIIEVQIIFFWNNRIKMEIYL